MQTSDFLTFYQKDSQEYYGKFFRLWQQQAKEAGNIPQEMIKRFATLYPKGKLFRGALVVLGYELTGGDRKSDILQASIMVEILHTSLLIADDVFDEDKMRRGAPTIHTQWAGEISTSNKLTKANYGKNMAFDTCIIGLYLAPLILKTTTFSPEIKLRALDYFFEKGIEVAWGEALDISSPWQNLVTKQKITQKIHDYKTVGYSGVLPLMLGAIFAGCQDQNKLQTLIQYGQCLGRIFQIKDDIIGSFGNQEKTGKSTDSDLKEARWTILMELLFQELSPTEKEKIKEIMGKTKRTSDDIGIIRNLMVRYQVVAQAQVKAQKYLEEGLILIPKLTDNPDYQDTLKNILEFMLKREK